MRVEVLREVVINISVFWDIMTHSSWKGNRSVIGEVAPIFRDEE
jgi:hypothetical protein